MKAWALKDTLTGKFYDARPRAYGSDLARLDELKNIIPIMTSLSAKAAYRKWGEMFDHIAADLKDRATNKSAQYRQVTWPLLSSLVERRLSLPKYGLELVELRIEVKEV